MTESNPTTATVGEHRGPHLGWLAVVFTILFNVGLGFVISFSANAPHFPGPWDSPQTIAAYFPAHARDVLWCAFFQLGSAIPLGLFTATIVSRLRFLGVRVAGVHIALFGGFLTAFNLAMSALVLWVMAYPGIAQDSAVIRALYYIVFAVGGVGYSIPLGLLIAGVSVPAAFMNLLPKWLVVFGLILAVCGELSWFSEVFPATLFLIPLTRFPGFLWLICAGFLLPKSTAEAMR